MRFSTHCGAYFRRGRFLWKPQAIIHVHVFCFPISLFSSFHVDFPTFWKHQHGSVSPFWRFTGNQRDEIPGATDFRSVHRIRLGQVLHVGAPALSFHLTSARGVTPRCGYGGVDFTQPSASRRTGHLKATCVNLPRFDGWLTLVTFFWGWKHSWFYPAWTSKNRVCPLGRERGCFGQGLETWILKEAQHGAPESHQNGTWR